MNTPEYVSPSSTSELYTSTDGLESLLVTAIADFIVFSISTVVWLIYSISSTSTIIELNT